MEMRPCNIWDVWHRIREKVEPGLKETVGGVEAFMREIEQKQTTVWRSEEGVAVLSLVSQADGKVDLFCRLAVSFGPSHDAVATHLPFLEKVAKDLGATRIRFRTRRRGFERALPSRWHVAHVEYVTEVEP